MEPTREQLKAWLRAALEKTSETPTGLARKSGLAQSTLTRFLNSEDAPMLGLRSIAKIAHAAGIEPIGLPMPPNHMPTASGFSEADGEPYRHVGATPLDLAIEALIDGRDATDPWRMKSRVLETAGYLPGDVLIVSLNERPQPGDVVCAQSYRWSEGRAETVFRFYEPPYLVAASRDENVRKPLLVDNDRVIIKGVVLAVLRVRRPAHSL